MKYPWTMIRHSLEAIILLELFSALGYFYPIIGTIAFVVGCLIVAWLAIRRLEWGLYVLAADLLISSKGYLLSLDLAGFKLSWRIGIWLVIMAVWSIQLLLALYRRQSWPREVWQRLKTSGWLVLLIMMIFATINAWWRGNQLTNIFFDANGWLFWLIFLPLLSVPTWSIKRLTGVLSAGMLWLVVKTSFLLYAFGHFSAALRTVIYRLVRDTQVGEITSLSAQFYRVFIQSQVYLLIFLAIVAWQLASHLPLKNWLKWLISRDGLFYLAAFSLSLMPIIVGFSRSFWFALALIMLFLVVAIWRRYRWPVVWRWSLTLLLAGFLSLVLIVVIVRFPWPRPQLSFNAGNLLEERLGNLDSEAGASSRWSLLPKMVEAIRQDPLLGQGFGATITYRSADPRILENESSGYYTTYAFEWGWLDIILKFGLLFAIWYFVWLGRLSWQAWRAGPVGQFLAIGLIVLAAVHFFSPYLNHPLGIGFLAGLIVWLSKQQNYVSLSRR
jgi:hypothetical protein